MRYLAFVTLLLVVILQALFLALPSILETMIVDTLTQEELSRSLPDGLVPSDLDFKIEKIGLGHTLVSGISMGDALSADFIDLQYHFKDLKSFQLEKITVTGLKVHALLDADNKLHFNGVILPPQIKNIPGDHGDPEYSRNSSYFGFFPKKVVLRKASLSITVKEREILIPFEILASLDSRNSQGILNASFHPLGQTIKTVISGGVDSGIEFFKVEAHSFHPEVLSELITDFVPEAGRIRFFGEVDIDIEKKPGTDLQLSLSGLNLDLPEFPGAKIEKFNGLVGTKSNIISARGGFDISGSKVPAMGVDFDLIVDLDNGKTTFPLFDLTMKNRDADEISLSQGVHEISFGRPNLLFILKGDTVRQTGEFLFEGKNFMAAFGSEKAGRQQFVANNIFLKSKIKGDFSEGGNGFEFDVTSNLSNTKIGLNPGRAKIGKVTLAGKVNVTKQFKPLVQLTAKIKNAEINFPEYKVAVTGINARLPFKFPFEASHEKGSFSIKEIQYDKKVKAHVQGTVTRKGPFGLKIGGKTSITGFDGFNLKFNGMVEAGANPAAQMNFGTDPFLLKPVHMGIIMPDLSLSDLSLSEDSFVQFSTKGTIEYKNNNLKTRASIMVDKGDLFFPDMDLTLKGIATRVDFNDLVVTESLPGQVLTIDRITAGQFQFNKAKFRFSIEDGKSINVENLRFNWCNGLVSTESIRVPSRDNILSLILYCDRLELASLLKEMGAFHAEGEGTLSGRIPVIYSNGNISFDRGFLFSTPGKGGRVVIENADSLTADIPMGTPEFVQLDLAREALRDFDYKSAKLELNTFEDTLYVKMELDGKPATPMPFVYKKEIGSFIRVDAKSPGSRFQGIKMNVNLKLPFNQVLKFGNKLNSILN